MTSRSLTILSLASYASAEMIYKDIHLLPHILKVHGTIMGLTFVILFPLGAFILRLGSKKVGIWPHVIWQVIAWLLMIVGFSYGIRAGRILDIIHNTTHTILGLIVVILLLLQPLFGLVHHRKYLATQQRTAWAVLHVWYGRILIFLGIINGGLGLKLAANSTSGNIAYGVLAGFIGVAYLSAMVIFELKWKDNKSKGDEREKAEERPQPTEA